VALGVDQKWAYSENLKENIRGPQILVLCTDGVWEAHNPAGDMFGKAALYEVIRRNSNLPAVDTVAAVVAEVRKFQDGVEPEDDITLVVAKMNL